MPRSVSQDTRALTGVFVGPELAELLPSWLLSLEAAGRSIATRRLYGLTARQLIAFLAAQPLPTQASALTRTHLEAYLADQRRQHPDTGTEATKYKALRSLCRWLTEEGEIPENPALRIPIPTIMERDIPVMPDVQVLQLLASCKSASFDDRRDLAILRVFVDTPLRRAEVAQLALVDVDLTERLLTVRVKGNRLRTVPFGVKTAQALDRYRRTRIGHRWAASDRLWLGERGPLSPDGLYRVLKKRAKAAGIDGFHPHLFRHLFAHGWLKEGGQEADLMRLGGWRSAEIMRKYGEQLAEERAVDAYRRLSPGDRF